MAIHGLSIKAFLGGAAAAFLLASCASIPKVRPTPAQAPLKERALERDERDFYGKSAGAPGALGGEALYYLGLDAGAAGDLKGAIADWRRVVEAHPGTGWDRLAAFKLAQTAEGGGDPLTAILWYRTELKGTPVADLPEQALAACLRLAAGMSEDQLKRLPADLEPAIKDAVTVRLIETAYSAGRIEEARKGVDDYLSAFPQGQGLARVEAISRKLESDVPVDKRAIGLIIPQSGPLADFGAQISRGVQLALDAANANRPPEDRLRLAVADEAGGTGNAVAAARGLIETQHVIGLLGPLTSEDAAALLPLLAARRTPLLNSSAVRPDLEEASPWFFRDTLSPERIAEGMADYASSARKLTRVACLAPDTAYGNASVRAFARRMKELGGEVALSLTYAPGTRDFHEAMLALGGVDPGEGKNADAEEKRDQQRKVEEVCNGLGRFLLKKAPDPDEASGVSPAARLKVLVVDFAEDTACAQLNAGRAFAERFHHTLSQIDQIDFVAPQAAEKYWKTAAPTAAGLTLPDLAKAGRAAGADFVVVGGTAEGAKDPSKPHVRRFSLTVQVVDVQAATVQIQKSFTWTKYEAPEANSAGYQALFLPAPAEDAALVAAGLGFFDLKLPMLGSDQWAGPALQDHLADLQGAVFGTGYWGDDPEPAVQSFETAYRKAYAARPGALAAQAYDAAALMAGAVLGGAVDRTGLREALSKVDGFAGASGRIAFKGKQDAQKRPTLVQVKDGALVPVKEP
jgi:ABC-type branched-subunit amino acid transport system substrate-binding protein